MAFVHLVIFRRRSKLIIVLIVFFHRGILSSCLGKINFLSTGAAAGIQDVASVNLSEIILVGVLEI